MSRKKLIKLPLPKKKCNTNDRFIPYVVYTIKNSYMTVTFKGKDHGLKPGQYNNDLGPLN